MTSHAAPGEQTRRSTASEIAATLVLTTFAACCCAIRLRWPSQLAVAAGTLALAIAFHKGSYRHRTTIFLVALSCYATLRYAFWRVRSVAELFSGRTTHVPWPDAVLVSLLLAAEAYTLFNLGLSYLQMLWPLRRGPVPLPDDTSLWPEIDLVIPTLDEPLHIVKYTALAALHLDWPPERLNVYLLDDGQREELHRFCSEAGIGYVVREDTSGAKAGNLNCALGRMSAPFVAVFDADHAPVRSFLQLTMGWFDRDPKLAVLQTPHQMYSPDPFERNLGSFRTVPNEGELFYGVVQDGNDLWNATYFCGTGAVLRRAALDSVGGFATETVTEDAHTSLRMQKLGWNTAYLNLPLAAGLATDRLRSHIGQRRRWARGMVQLLRIENPLFARGLSFAQRLCYLHAAAYFLYALPRLIFLLAPVAFLVFGRLTLPGYWAAVVAFAAPHLVLGYLANARLQGSHRYSFWNEVYETVLAPFLLWPTFKALFSSGGGHFEPTVKGDVVQETYFDSGAAWPPVALTVLNGASLLFAGLRLLPAHLLNGTGAFGRVLNLQPSMHNPGYLGAVLLNVVWTLFNLMILNVALGVARETRQRRRAVRLPKSIRAGVVLPDGTLVQGATEDISHSGVLLRIEGLASAWIGDAVSLVLPLQGLPTTLPATVIEATAGCLRMQFDALTLKEEEALAGVLFSPADAWVDLGQGVEEDRPLHNLFGIARLALSGVGALLGRRRGLLVSRLLFGMLCVSGCGAVGMLLATAGVRAAGAGTMQNSLQHDGEQHLRTAGVLHLSQLTQQAGPLELTEAAPSRTLHFGLPAGEVVTRASLRLRYRTSPSIAPVAAVSVSVNGVTLKLSSTGRQEADQPSAPGIQIAQTALVALPPELLVPDNVLVLSRPPRVPCKESDCSSYTVEIDPESEISLSGTPLAASASPAAPLASHSRRQGRPSAPGVAQSGLKAVGSAVFENAWSAVLVGPGGIAACFLLGLLWQRALRRRAGTRLNDGIPSTR